MSKKSARSHLSRSKRKKGKSAPLRVAVQKQPVAQPAAVSHLTATPAPPVKEAAPLVTSARGRHPSIYVEMRRIGILAGIILVILVVLAVALP